MNKSSEKFQNYTTMAAIFGRTVAVLRQAKGFDQQTFAEKVKIPRATWSRVENGSTSLSVEDLPNVENVLGLAPGELMKKVAVAADRLRAGGIQITPRRAEPEIDDTLLVLGAAALAAVIATAIFGNKK